MLDRTTSPAPLSREEEARFRCRQYLAGLLISSLLAAVTLLTLLRETVLVWLFAPVIALPYVLAVRARMARDWPQVCVAVTAASTNL